MSGIRSLFSVEYLLRQVHRPHGDAHHVRGPAAGREGVPGPRPGVSGGGGDGGRAHHPGGGQEDDRGARHSPTLRKAAGDPGENVT